MKSDTTTKELVASIQQQPMREEFSDLQILGNLIPSTDYVFGARPTSVDTAIYGFIANIYFLPIETPLKQFVSSRSNLIRHCIAIHKAIGRDQVVQRSA